MSIDKIKNLEWNEMLTQLQFHCTPYNFSSILCQTCGSYLIEVMEPGNCDTTKLPLNLVKCAVTRAQPRVIPLDLPAFASYCQGTFKKV